MKKVLLLIIFFLSSAALMAQSGNDNKSALKLSFSERLRIETYDNVNDLNTLGTGNQTYTRTKSTLGLDWTINPDLFFGFKLTNEFRKYMAPKKNPFHWNELFVEGLYLKVNNIFNGTLTVGRQDISLGDGLIIKDGTPYDGTRDNYFNAVRFDLKLNKENTITFLGVYQPKEDNLLPVLNGHDIDAAQQGTDSYILDEQTENGFGAYYTGDFGKFNLQGYYFFKTIFNDGKKIVPGSEIHTIGAKIKNQFDAQLALLAEGAYQFGTIGDYSRSAYALTAYLEYKPGFKQEYLPKTIMPGFILLSGDDPATKDCEGWDPVFGRWPNWSTSYALTLAKEFGRSAYWSNIMNLYIKLDFAVAKDVNFTLQNEILYAPQKSAKTTLLSGDGTYRGNLTTALISYKFNGNMSGHFLWEHLEAGDYYFVGHSSGYDFVRMELAFAL